MPTRLLPRAAPLLLIALGATLGCSSSKTAVASGQSTIAKTASSSLGTIVVDSSGRTLYHFDSDHPGQIACLAGCTSVWPPMVVTSTPSGTVGGGTLSAVTRPDGSQQLTWNGLPLYHYAQDHAAGDTKGDGFGGLWHATRASGAATTTSTPAGRGGYGY